MLTATWEPAAEYSKEEIVETSNAVLARPDLPFVEREDVFRLTMLGYDWDIGGKVYEPADPTQQVVGPDGKKAGIYLLHGGAGDFRTQEPMARLLAGKFGYKVATMSYVGQHYFPDPSRRWPGDTLYGNGQARSPVWTVDSGEVPPDQYELLEDRSDPVLYARHGTLFFLRAKEGSEFYYRLACGPRVTEEAIKTVLARNFPVGEWSIYMHGHSTGGPQVHMMLQRVENIVGLVGTESSPYGMYFSKMLKYRWPYPFNYMTVRTWRDRARYTGPELGIECSQRLPVVIEEILEDWEQRKHLANIKFQDLIQFAAWEQLEEAARVTAKRLELNEQETETLVQRYLGYPKPLSGPGVKPVPTLLYGVTEHTMDHRPERYKNILLPALGELDPAPKRRLVEWRTGVHSYMRPEPELPMGVGPAIANMWNEAIKGGYYLAGES
jgi:hypothetical protein